MSAAAKLRQALDLLAGLHPCLTVEEHDPMRQAEAIFNAVLAEQRNLIEKHDSAERSIQWLLSERRGPGSRGAAEEVGLPVSTYEVCEGVQIMACRQRDGSRLWAVRRDGCEVLNRSGEWEDEPSPSGRDAAFLIKCRYATALEARDAYMLHFGPNTEASGQRDQTTGARQPVARPVQ